MSKQQQIIILFIFGICMIKVGSIDIENQICGYNGDSLVCCSAYSKDELGECTIPVCVSDCGAGGKCIRPNECYCANGRVAFSCPDEHDDSMKRQDSPGECTGNCYGQGVCVNGKCKCHVGYSGEFCLEKLNGQCYISLSRGLCQKSENELKSDIEVCCGAFNVAWGDPCQRCPKTRCERGFMEVDGICHDVNECLIAGLCRHGQCRNTEGSYRCACSKGSQFDPRKGDCVKMKDVCQQTPNVCGRGMKCITMSKETYVCQCLDGYTKTPDKKSCELKKRPSFDFCAAYGKYVCQFGKCKSVAENYQCECEPGYKPSSDRKSCKKSIDYCALYQSMLCPNGACVSTDGDYMCNCDPGYTASVNRKKCTSICDLYPASLCPNGRCIPQPTGRYECRCNEGYSAIGKGKECRRIMNDQSASQSNVNHSSDSKTSEDTDYCSYDYYKKQCHGGRCTNKRGYYQCECLNDYVPDKNGLACKKIDKSTSDQMLDVAGAVDLKSYCDKYGSFVCANGVCVESGSSYQCRCNSGYKESSDGKTCYDINECTSTANICIQGTCINSPGSYQCSCYDGFTVHYQPGGPKCYDRNECEEDDSLCKNGRCINKWGSYACSCHTGYITSRDKKQCISVTPSVDKTSSRDVKCNDECLRSCNQINATHYHCSCPIGLSPVLNTKLCADMSRVEDIQFDVPVSRDMNGKISNDKTKNIFFKLVPGSDNDLFVTQVTARLRTTTVERCHKVDERGRKGIVCVFYNEASK